MWCFQGPTHITKQPISGQGSIASEMPSNWAFSFTQSGSSIQLWWILIGWYRDYNSAFNDFNTKWMKTLPWILLWHSLIGLLAVLETWGPVLSKYKLIWIDHKFVLKYCSISSLISQKEMIVQRLEENIQEAITHSLWTDMEEEQNSCSSIGCETNPISPPHSTPSP